MHRNIALELVVMVNMASDRPFCQIRILAPAIVCSGRADLQATITALSYIKMLPLLRRLTKILPAPPLPR